jgi:hypothetical protein
MLASGRTPQQRRLVVSNNSASLPAGLSGTTLHIGGADGSNNRFTSDAFGGANIFNYRRANNTATSPSALAPDDLIGQFSWLGFGSTAYSTARAAIAANASQTWTDANQGTYLTFFTTLNNTAAPLERMRIDNAGNVGIGTTSPTAILHIQGSGVSIPLLGPSISREIRFLTLSPFQCQAKVEKFGSWRCPAST